MNATANPSERFPDWETRYREEQIEELPWFHPDIDPDFDRILRAIGLEGGDVLDLGSGPGTQAIALARRGFRVTGTDISITAVEKSRARAEAEGVAVTFLHDDFRESTIEGRFDLVIDRGCFHVFEPEQRPLYRDAIHDRLVPGGHLLLKCFSYREPGDEGPYRFTPQMVEEAFVPPFRLRSLEESVFVGKRQPSPHALVCLFERGTA